MLSRIFALPSRCRVLRGGRLGSMPVLVAVLLTVGSAAGLVTSFPTPRALAAPAPGPVLGQACPDVMVIAARGASEQPQPQTNPPTSPWYGTWSDPAAYTHWETYYGIGKFNYDVYQRLADPLADPGNRLRFSLDPVRYPADPAFPEAVTDYNAFKAAADAGAYSIVTEIARTRAACGDRVRFVLAGYSEGAWSVHKALYALDTQNDGSLDLVSAVVLFGDPEFQLGQVIDRGSQIGLINSGLATLVDPRHSNVPVALRARTASYCLPGDPVCQGLSPVVGLPNLVGAAYLAYCWRVNWAEGKCPHTSYETSGATTEAAAFVRPLLPVVVPADAEGGVNTGIYALKGDTIVITATGTAGYGYEGTPPCVGYPTTDPDGNRYLGNLNCGPKDDPDAALPGAAIGLLIARFGGGAWFAVGTGTTVTAHRNGYIYLAYNDTAYTDNTGSYSATITKHGR